MEFQEALMKLMIQKTQPNKSFFERNGKDVSRTTKRRWRISIERSPPPADSSSRKIPKEFVCPVSGLLMADPVIVSSGHSFDRACVEACKNLGFIPDLADSTPPDFSAVIPNLALRTTILNWCATHSLDPPKPRDAVYAENLVRKLMQQSQKANPGPLVVSISEKELIQGMKDGPPMRLERTTTDLTRRPTHFSSSSDESVASPTRSLHLATRPSCFSSPCSSEIECLSAKGNPEEEALLTKLKSSQVSDVEEALSSLRQITKSREESRAHLCTASLLSALRSLVTSRYTRIQVNSVAALVNLSLARSNKVMIVRSGMVPPLIDVLKMGSPEAQEHASGALFSLSLEDENKTAIGVLGALEPLLHQLRVGSARARHDSAMALYHLSLAQSNRSKMVKLGSVPVFLNMLKSGQMPGRVLLILGNLSSCPVGRAALLDSGAVECLVGLLRRTELDEPPRESCVAVLYGLSHGGELRFKGLAMAANAEEVLCEVERWGSKRARAKAERMLEVMRMKSDEPEEEIDWEELLESGAVVSRGGRSRRGKSDSGSTVGEERAESGGHSSEF